MQRQIQGNTLIITVITHGAIKKTWIFPLAHQAVNICDKNKLQAELTRIKDLIAWNGCPKRIGDVIMNNKLKGLNVNNIMNRTNNDFETIWIQIPYVGDKGDKLLKSLKKFETPLY